MTTEPMNSEAASQPSSYATAEPIPVVITKDETAEKVRAATYGGWSAFQFAGTEKQAVQVLRFDERRRRAVLLCLPGTGSTVPVVTNIAVSNPAAGAEWSYTVPAGTTLDIQSIQMAFATSAVVANRYTNIVIKDPTGTQVYMTGASAATAAGASGFIIFHTDITGAGPAIINGSMSHFVLPAGWTIGTTTVGIQAGDQYNSIEIVGYVRRTNQAAAVAGGNLWIGSKAQIANGNPSGSGGMLTSGASITIESATDIWCMPDGTNPLTLVVLDELYRT